MRAKHLIGPGGGIDTTDTPFGILEIDTGAAHPSHRHAAPEVYCVLSGRAECHFRDEVFEAGPGSVLRTAPDTIHGFRVLGDQPFRAVACWWAPAGGRSVPGTGLELVDGTDDRTC